MAFLAVSLWSGLLVWAALKTAASLRASCLSASSSPADKISITECTNESLNFTWSIHISTEDLALVKFEYSCINASSVTIIKNETILNNDGPTGAGNAMFTPVSGATCLISACYTDSGNNFHYITPTGCTASPSTLQKGATFTPSDMILHTTSSHTLAPLTSGPTSAILLAPLASSSPPAAAKGVTVNLAIGVAAGVITLAVTAASALGIVAVVCLGRAARSKIYQRELMQIGRDITEMVDHNYIPVQVKTSPSHQMHASSECSVLDGLEWFPVYGFDCTDDKLRNSFVDPNECQTTRSILEILEENVDPCMIASLEQHPSDFADPAMNNESMSTMNSGFSITSTGYCTFNRSE